ncbi:hypothetical protein GCM10011418_25370 [Sphingobacterium alkalisoli]|nr:hypothetical protein GCM10011418_25370 [Sphingobacterium alkalisoli]
MVFYNYRGRVDAEFNLDNTKNNFEIKLKSGELMKVRYLAKTNQMLILLTLEQTPTKIHMINQDEILFISKPLGSFER